MNREDVVRMALEVGFAQYGEDAGEYRIPTPAFHGRLERFAALVAEWGAKQEREAILNLADSLGWVDVDAIRARGQEPPR